MIVLCTPSNVCTRVVPGEYMPIKVDGRLLRFVISL
jgi:hypothetical protein